MGAGQSVPADKHVVIVGAGYGGTTLALGLLKQNSNFTLVSPGDCFHHNIGAVRAVCVPGFAPKTLIPLQASFGAHFKSAKVTEVQPGERRVVLDTGETLTYDLLVVATGSVNSWPMKLVGAVRDEACSQYAALVEKVKTKARVSVIGGGATGVELAAEIAVAYPDKKVTLIHGNEHLLTPKLTLSRQQALQAILRDLNIKLVLGERVENLADLPEEEEVTIHTDKGTEIPADIVFKCIGLRVNTQPYQNGLSASMTEHGTLRVDDFLQVQGQADIYALGDCTDVPETKLAYHAQAQARVLLSTINAITNGGAPTKYTPQCFPLATSISVGPNMGFAQLPAGCAVPGFVITFLKSKDLLTERTWNEFNQTLVK